MKAVVLRVYDFIAGGSIAAPAGLAAAMLVAYFGGRIPAPALAALFLAILLATFFASTLERAR